MDLKERIETIYHSGLRGVLFGRLGSFMKSDEGKAPSQYAYSKHFIEFAERAYAKDYYCMGVVYDNKTANRYVIFRQVDHMDLAMFLIYDISEERLSVCVDSVLAGMTDFHDIPQDA